MKVVSAATHEAAVRERRAVEARFRDAVADRPELIAAAEAHGYDIRSLEGIAIRRGVERNTRRVAVLRASRSNSTEPAWLMAEKTAARLGWADAMSDVAAMLDRVIADPVPRPDGPDQNYLWTVLEQTQAPHGQQAAANLATLDARPDRRSNMIMLFGTNFGTGVENEYIRSYTATMQGTGRDGMRRFIEGALAERDKIVAGQPTGKLFGKTKAAEQFKQVVAASTQTLHHIRQGLQRIADFSKSDADRHVTAYELQVGVENEPPSTDIEDAYFALRDAYRYADWKSIPAPDVNELENYVHHPEQLYEASLGVRQPDMRNPAARFREDAAMDYEASRLMEKALREHVNVQRYRLESLSEDATRRSTEAIAVEAATALGQQHALSDALLLVRRLQADPRRTAATEADGWKQLRSTQSRTTSDAVLATGGVRSREFQEIVVEGSEQVRAEYVEAYDKTMRGFEPGKPRAAIAVRQALSVELFVPTSDRPGRQARREAEYASDVLASSAADLSTAHRSAQQQATRAVATFEQKLLVTQLETPAGELAFAESQSATRSVA